MTETQDPSPKAPTSWAIVGGGMLGLTLAHRLAQHGQKVTIFEARPSLGGLADAWTLGDVRWDRHYHVTLLSDSNLRALLAELDLEKELEWVETRTGFYTNGKFYSMSSTWEFLNFPPLRLIEKLRLGGTIFLASKIRNWRRMEKLPVETWLRRWSGDSTFEKIWLPLLRAKLGNAYRRTSAAFIWAHISRMYKARRTGHKKEMFGYVPGGYGRILDTLNESLQSRGVDIVLDSKIRDINSSDSSSSQIEFEDGSRQNFDHVILTTPSSVVPKICRGLSPKEMTRHADVEYLGIVCASLLLRKPLKGYYVTNITDEVPFTAVIEMTTIVSPEELNGNTLVYLPKYVTQDDPIFNMTDQQVEDRFMDTFLKMYPELQPSDITAFRISRVRNVMAIPTLNYSEKLPPMETSIPGVYVINSAHILKGNLNVNETIGLADESFNQHLLPLIEDSTSIQEASRG
ncbi:MAG: NAD(P)/FAD-dependent oxidoreductase [Planctomycetota bacterium]